MPDFTDSWFKLLMETPSGYKLYTDDTGWFYVVNGGYYGQVPPEKGKWDAEKKEFTITYHYPQPDEYGDCELDCDDCKIKLVFPEK